MVSWLVGLILLQRSSSRRTPRYTQFTLKSTRLYLDRVEGETAVLIWERSELVIPVQLLPDGAREGHWLTVAFEIDAAETAAAKQRVTQLIEELSGDA